jgi:23S rRNA pseudouridine2605 synthase
MRINAYVAQSTGWSRRQSDQAIVSGRVTVNGATAELGQQVSASDIVTADGKKLILPESKTIMLNKPVGYVVSRNGQGSPTVYDLLPKSYQTLKPVGRLDKDSSGLLLLTNDGQLAAKLTHPTQQKQKVYIVHLDKPLREADEQKMAIGIKLEDGPSKLQLAAQSENRQLWQVTMHEGRNRQIRRTFAAIGYEVAALHRIKIDDYELSNLREGSFQAL